MAKFKVGDRVRKATTGRAGTVDAPFEGYMPGERVWVCWDDSEGRRKTHIAVDQLQEVLKLEVGATVRLKDGVDEWIVDSVGTGYLIYAHRAGYDHPRISATMDELVVVKGKPEDPKPDYYVNCKGAEPKDGDVFVSDRMTVHISGKMYTYLGLPYQSWPLDDGSKCHSIGRTVYQRTLLVRDGQPYTG